VTGTRAEAALDGDAVDEFDGRTAAVTIRGVAVSRAGRSTVGAVPAGWTSVVAVGGVAGVGLGWLSGVDVDVDVGAVCVGWVVTVACMVAVAVGVCARVAVLVGSAVAVTVCSAVAVAVT